MYGDQVSFKDSDGTCVLVKLSFVMIKLFISGIVVLILQIIEMLRK